MTPGSVRFVQTVGGRPPIPAPRRVAHKPFVQLRGPTVWTTLSLTIHADGSVEHQLAGASAFPRHWIYDASGTLSQKSGLMDFDEWYHHAFGKHSPWGDEDPPALSVEVDGEALAEVGPGALPGERAVLEGGLRPATLHAVAPCRVAFAAGDAIDKAALGELSEGHRREEAPPA